MKFRTRNSTPSYFVNEKTVSSELPFPPPHSFENEMNEALRYKDIKVVTVCFTIMFNTRKGCNDTEKLVTLVI